MAYVDSLLQPILTKFGANVPDELQSDARAVFSDAVGWLNRNIPDDATAAAAIGLSAAGTAQKLMPVVADIEAGLKSTDSMAAFTDFCMAMGALCPAAAPFIGAFVAGVEAVVQSLEAMGAWAHGAGDPCAANGARWFGNFDLAHELPPAGPSDPRWVHWTDDGGRGNCGYMAPDPALVALARDAMAGHQTPFDKACAVAWAHALEAYANAKGPSEFMFWPGWIVSMRNAWNLTHAGIFRSDGSEIGMTFYAKRQLLGRDPHWEQFYSGQWNRIPAPAGGPIGWGSDFSFVSYILSKASTDDATLHPLELTVHGGPLVPELRKLLQLTPPKQRFIMPTMPTSGFRGFGFRGGAPVVPAPAVIQIPSLPGAMQALATSAPVPGTAPAMPPLAAASQAAAAAPSLVPAMPPVPVYAPAPVKPLGVPHAAVLASAVPPSGSPGAPPGATNWTCTPGPDGSWMCRWV
jgi:hypothetical protein